MTMESSRISSPARFWEFLTAAHPSIKDTGDRRQAQLAASIGLIFTLLNLVGFIFTSAASSAEEALPAFGGGVLASAAAYVLGRTRFYPMGTFLIALSLIGSEYLAVRSRPLDVPFDGTFFTYSTLSLLIGSAILPNPVLLLVLGINIVTLFGLTGMGHILVTNQVGAAGVAITIGTLLIFLNITRNNIEKARLGELRSTNQKLEAIQFSLEERVNERTLELDRRSTQLEAAAFVARQAAAIQDLSALLNETVSLITGQFGYYHAGVFLVDESNQTVVLRAASSEGGQRMLARGHRLEIGREGIVGYAAYQKQPRIALDVGTEAIFFNNPDLPKTHSEIALPLVVKGKLIGVLDIQSTLSNAFQPADVYTLQTMADQVALAIENSRLITEGQLVIQQLEAVTTTTTLQSWREWLGYTHKGYVYTPLGISLLTQEQQIEKVNSEETVNIPITLRGQHIGNIRLTRRGTHATWSQKEKDLTDDIATQVGLALENARLLEESQKRAIREQTINDISARLNRALDVDSLLKTATRELHQLPHVAEVSVYIAPPEELDGPKFGERK